MTLGRTHWPKRRWGRRGRPVAALSLAVFLMVTVSAAVAGGPTGKRITAFFAAAVGVHPGSDVRVLGVKVGTVDQIRPMGTRVRIRLTLHRGVRVPADAKAVVVAPSVVSDRYVQLTPAFTGGAEIADGAEIPLGRTATPAELDELYDSLKRMSTDLGPGGVNSTGALSRALRAGAGNLGGNGKALNDTIAQFGKASRTLAGSSDALFGTVANLQRFTTMIRQNDTQVRQAERQMSEVTGFLAADRDELAAALRELAIALGQVRDFIRDHRALLKKDVDKLASLTQVLVDQRRSLAEAFDVLPLNATNMLNAYDPVTGTLTGRGDLNEISMGPIDQPAEDSATAGPGSAASRPVCASSAAATEPWKALCARARAGEQAPVPRGPAAGTLPALPLPAVGETYASSAAPARGGGR